MQMSRKRSLGFGAPLAVLIVLAAGCGGADESTGDVQAQTSAWHRYPRPTGTGGAPSGTGGAPAGSSGSAGTSGTRTVDCNVCTITQACCEAVNAATNNGRTCGFSTETCFSLDAERQNIYAVQACLVTLRTTISAWQLAGRTPPAACRLP
jgi:hypothetical protein